MANWFRLIPIEIFKYYTSILITGKSCPEGMHLINGKCVAVVKNSVPQVNHQKNCRWKSNSISYSVTRIPEDSNVSYFYMIMTL